MITKVTSNISHICSSFFFLSDCNSDELVTEMKQVLSEKTEEMTLLKEKLKAREVRKEEGRGNGMKWLS